MDDIWSDLTDQKANSDFLRHLKFEYLQYGLTGSLLFNAIVSSKRFKNWMPIVFYQENVDDKMKELDSD